MFTLGKNRKANVPLLFLSFILAINCSSELHYKGNILSFHLLDKTKLEKNVKEVNVFESSSFYIYPERFFIVEKLTSLENITIIRVSYPKNRLKICDVYSINDPLDDYKSLREIAIGDTVFLDLIPVFITESDSTVCIMQLDSLNLLSNGYSYVKTIWGMYNDGGIFTARNTVGGFLIEDGQMSKNTPERFLLKRNDANCDLLRKYYLFVKSLS